MAKTKRGGEANINSSAKARDGGAIVVTGIGGGLAQGVARRLVEEGREVVGVDYRKTVALPGVTTYRASYDKSAFEDVFKRHRVAAVLHLGRVGDLAENIDLRFDLNVIGTQKLMNLCVQHRVATLVVHSTFHIYGAHPRNHTPISEEDPLRAGHEFPEIADAIQLDSMASTFVHQFKETTRIVVLRPTNVVGPSIHNTMSSILRMPRVPYILGFNPMSQFIHEQDLGSAILAALDGGRGQKGADARGVFNIAGASAVPWRSALEVCGAQQVPVPSSLVRVLLRAFAGLPAYLVNFLMYPCVITDKAFRDTFDWAPTRNVTETLRTTVAQARGWQ